MKSRLKGIHFLFICAVPLFLAGCLGGGDGSSAAVASGSPPPTGAPSERFSVTPQTIDTEDATVVVKRWRALDNVNVQREIPATMVVSMQGDVISIDKSWDTSTYATGDIIASTFGEAGFLRRIVSVMDDGTSVRLTTEAVKLTEIFSELDFDVNLKEISQNPSDAPTQARVDAMVESLEATLSDADAIDFQQESNVSPAQFSQQRIASSNVSTQSTEFLNITRSLKNAPLNSSVVIDSGPFSLEETENRGTASGGDLIFNLNEPTFSCCFLEGMGGRKLPVVTFGVTSTFGYQFRIKDSIGDDKSAYSGQTGQRFWLKLDSDSG